VPSPSMHQSNPPGGVGDRPGGDGTGAAMFTVQCVMKEARRNFTFLMKQASGCGVVARAVASSTSAQRCSSRGESSTILSSSWSAGKPTKLCMTSSLA
jgi:hypothetical protein